MSKKLRKLAKDTLKKVSLNIGFIPSNLEFKYEYIKYKIKNCCD